MRTLCQPARCWMHKPPTTASARHNPEKRGGRYDAWEKSVIRRSRSALLMEVASNSWMPLVAEALPAKLQKRSPNTGLRTSLGIPGQSGRDETGSLALETCRGREKEPPPGPERARQCPPPLAPLCTQVDHGAIRPERASERGGGAPSLLALCSGPSF